MMLKLQLPCQAISGNNAGVFLLNKPLPHGITGRRVQLPRPATTAGFRKGQRSVVGVGSIKANSNNNIKAVAGSASGKTVTVGAELTVMFAANDTTDPPGLLLELVSADPKTGSVKGTIQVSKEKSTAKCSFEVPSDFGEIGAIPVESKLDEEMFLRDIVLDGLPNGPVNIKCESWVPSKANNTRGRVFFTNKSYIPSETPSGLEKLRKEELVALCGDGHGERKSYERIYDYDMYNDLVDPDTDKDPERPKVLGGKELPYPRRCRTGRPRCVTDRNLESRSKSIYVPRDEQFAETKRKAHEAQKGYSGLHAVAPSLETTLEPDLGRPHGDRFFWLRDAEFARQTLAGTNPMAIQLVKKWPLKSNLKPEEYGPAESAITAELVEREIGGSITVEKAIEQKRLFILDYHDLLLPFVDKVRKLEGTTLYGSRTLFYLTPEGSLRPTAIELTRPQARDGSGTPQWRQVFRPSSNGIDAWLWRLAKTHVLAHDSGYHQLVSHWLRTHCCTEPYIIAMNRNLSAMHPIYRLLHPHFRYTMAINAQSRDTLINGGGIIESCFFPKGYSMELSAVAYKELWQFDKQALPEDLKSRGLAMEDPSAPDGLMLVIEDYPYANDGLLIWDALKQWVTDYVKHYYPGPNQVADDDELKAWWTEIRTVGHEDKKDADGWPRLETTTDLIKILTTIIWVTSGHHAAVNFGQYAYGGYFPSRPTIARIKMPVEDDHEKGLKSLMEDPEAIMLNTFPSLDQATQVMVTLEVLSSHSPDEKYLGEHPEPSWKEDPVIAAAFEKFSGRLKEIEGIINERNANPKLKNRNGAGIPPYQLLKPFSKPGVTGKGVPNSISI